MTEKHLNIIYSTTVAEVSKELKDRLNEYGFVVRQGYKSGLASLEEVASRSCLNIREVVVGGKVIARVCDPKEKPRV